MSWESMQEFLRCDWPSGNGHTGQVRVVKVLGLYAELEENGEAYPSQNYIANELELHRRDVQHAIKVLQATGFLTFISKHSTGRRGNTYRISIPAKTHSTGPDGNNDGDPDGNNDGDPDGDAPSTTDKQTDRQTNLILGRKDKSELAQHWDELTVHEKRVKAARHALQETASDHACGSAPFDELLEQLDQAFFADVLAALKNAPVDNAGGLRDAATNYLRHFIRQAVVQLTAGTPEAPTTTSALQNTGNTKSYSDFDNIDNATAWDDSQTWFAER